MRTTLLLAALLLMPLSAGAEECDKSIVLTSNPPQYKCKEQPESEKWRELCEEYLSRINPARTSLLNSSIESHREDSMRLENTQIATAYCTRYNSAMLEEIRKELNED